jgi:hypothetical protein
VDAVEEIVGGTGDERLENVNFLRGTDSFTGSSSVGVRSLYISIRGLDNVFTLTVSSSAGIILLRGESISLDAAVAHVSTVLSEGVVSSKRDREILVLRSADSSLSLDFSVSD